jgi:hypothetical protein
MGTPLSENAFEVWTLYDNPKEMPGYFVLRLLVMDKGEVLGSPEAFWCKDPEPLRAKMRARGLVCMTRSPKDEPHIVETWI